MTFHEAEAEWKAALALLEQAVRARSAASELAGLLEERANWWARLCDELRNAPEGGQGNG